MSSAEPAKPAAVSRPTVKPLTVGRIALGVFLGNILAGAFGVVVYFLLTH